MGALVPHNKGIFMKRLLTDKAGVTVLEGIIALGLLALVAGGAFGVLLAASRQSTQPDIREEMVLAVDEANNRLKVFTGRRDTAGDFQWGLCNNDMTPLSDGNHVVNCLLPPICDPHNSDFTYRVGRTNVQNGAGETVGVDSITFNITCNGYSL